MKESAVKMRKGGLDTIVAYIVVIIPLLYVLVYMVATIYHFSVQMYMNQVVKEATVMISTYGEVTEAHESYIYGKLKGVLGADENGNTNCTIRYYKKPFDEESGTVGKILPYEGRPEVSKADIIGIEVTSIKNSILDSVTNFSAFGYGEDGTAYKGGLKYTSYREEIIRNEKKFTP